MVQNCLEYSDVESFNIVIFDALCKPLERICLSFEVRLDNNSGLCVFLDHLINLPKR